MPYNSSTPVLYYNKDAFEQAGLDPNAPPKTWGEFGEVLDALKASGSSCPFTTAWQSWIHLETFSAWHNVPFATKENGFAGRSEEHTSALQSLMSISYAVFVFKTKNVTSSQHNTKGNI